MRITRVSVGGEKRASDGDYHFVCGYCRKPFVPKILTDRQRTYECHSRVCANKARGRPIGDRIQALTDRSAGPDACWPWAGARDKNGYGLVQLNRKLRRVTHIVLELDGRPLEAGDEQALHHCDNPPCCNPAHLFVGTNAVNHADKAHKGRSPAGARNGRAKLTEAAVLDIRRRIADGGTPLAALARTYGVSSTAIYDVLRGDSWRCVTA
jgi:hypothetical protein